VHGGTFGIGEAARRAGISPDLIRYYERVGVLPRAPRTAGGFRSYSEDTIARLLLVRNAIRFGFSSKELAGFLKARESGRPPCQSVRAAGARLLQEMDEQLARMQETRAAMTETLAAWDTRLSRTPSGAPAHLLTIIPDAPQPRRRSAPVRPAKIQLRPATAVPESAVASNRPGVPDAHDETVATEADERLGRIEALVHKLAAELESVREEARIVAESISAHSKARVETAKRAQQNARDAERRAADREQRTQQRTRRKRR